MSSTRELLLHAARDAYLEEGLPGFSLRKVGARAGLSATAAYRHFDGKEDLLWAVVQEGHEQFARYLARGLRGADPLDRLVRTGEGYLDFALDHRPWYLVMFVAPPEHLGLEKLAQNSADEGATSFRMLVDRVRECVDAGLLVGDPEGASLQIWAFVHGLVTLYYRVPVETEAGKCMPGTPPPFATPALFRAFYLDSVTKLLRGLAP